jgi:hypothetical protein
MRLHAAGGPGAADRLSDSKKSTLSGRIRLREKSLQSKFCGRRGQGIHVALTAVTLISWAYPSYSSGVGRLYAEDLIVKIEGAAGTMIVSA